MKKKKRDPMEAGLIIKQITPILGITIGQLVGHFPNNELSIEDSRLQHYLMGETPWPFEDMGYDACLEMAHDILKEQQLAGKLSEHDTEGKLQEIEKILKVAFMDIDTLSFHGRKSWATESADIYNNSKAGLTALPIPYNYLCESEDVIGHSIEEGDDTTANPIDSIIEWIMRDIDNLDIETLYILNRYFDAFSCITEQDLKWIDYLDCLGHSKELLSWKEFERMLSKETIAISGELILGNMGNKAFGQWMELLSRKSYKDTTRKLDSNKIEKLKADMYKKLNLNKKNLGLEGFMPLLNFIHYLIEEHKGSFFDVGRNYWKMFISIKFWFNHFLKGPEIFYNIY